MRTRHLLLVFLACGVTACATARLDKLDPTLRAYERAIRWSDFKTAFAVADQPDAPPPDFQRLQDVRVTSYEKLGALRPDADGMKVVQAVEIRYVYVNKMSERTLSDQQVWIYLEKEQRWRLTSPFPSFR